MTSIIKVNELQDAGGNTIISSNGTGTFTSNLGGGITVADQWRLSANASAAQDLDLTSNLERVDTTGQGTLGTGMTESSGVFTFPSTGIYLVTFNAVYGTSTASRYVIGYIRYTGNNSSYSNIAEGRTALSIEESGSSRCQTVTSTLLDITDTANQKVKFRVTFNQTSNNQVNGDTSINQTHMTFLRIGDT